MGTSRSSSPLKVGHGHEQMLKPVESRSWTRTDAEAWGKNVMGSNRCSSLEKVGHGNQLMLKHGESRLGTGAEAQLWGN